MTDIDDRWPVDDAVDQGRFRVDARIYSDPAILDQEMAWIFERTWGFLGVSSQVAKPHDFITTPLGRVNVLVTRGADGKVRAFLNACRHKGALLTRLEAGRKRTHSCPYHGWSFDSSGANVLIKDAEAGAYSAAFDCDAHDLVPLARFEEYKGLMFGSLSPDVPPLAEFLGEARALIDLAMEQGPNGMEVIPGRSVYTYRGNWKLQMDNGMDFYHLTSTHPAFMDLVQRRDGERAGNTDAKAFDWRKRLTQVGGAFGFRHGHAAIWLEQPQPEKRPLWPVIDELKARVGETRARWMLKLRNMTVFPNLQIADSTSLILRTFRPIRPDLTEMRAFCLAPIGEAPEQRAWRLRQFEDFFNAAGLATSDDTVVYEDCQRGMSSQLGWLQGYSRGIGALSKVPNVEAEELAMKPAYCLKGPFKMQNEVVYHAPYREWRRLMRAGQAQAPAYPAAKEQA